MYIKTLVVLKHQRFDNYESEEMAVTIYKHQQFNEHNNKKGQSLDKNKGDNDGDRYILLYHINLLLLP